MYDSPLLCLRRARVLAMCTGLLIVAPARLTAAPPATTTAEDGNWRLVWKDDFERQTLGTGWAVVSGTATIRDGRLHLTGAGSTILVNRSFGPDVKLTFVAQADPERSPCDISVGLNANPISGYHYLLAFGANFNQWNQIWGRQKVRDENPRKRIEPGRWHHMTAIREGPELSYWADGEKLISVHDKDPIWGPGLDHVGLVTWNGMLVEEVAVYERITPAPGGPRPAPKLPQLPVRWADRLLTLTGEADAPAREAVAAYNARDYGRAIELARSAPISPASVAVWAYTVGDVGHVESPAEQAALRAAAEQLAAQRPEDAGLQDFARAADWFSRISMTRRDHVSAQRLIGLGPENNPFYYKAVLYLGRYLRAAGLEGADQGRLASARERFNELRKIWPEHPGLRELTGELLPWGEELIRPESDGPAWARGLQEAYARHEAVLRWWVTHRQAPDGQLGGGWGDDVELMRLWVPIACISTAGEEVVRGIERLADGVWEHAMEDGWERGIGDVEHSAEPSADSQPTMMLLRYGHPKWVERNLVSARTVREKFMALNEKGRLQFISSEFGAGGVRTHAAAGGDTGYHARAMKHFIWLAWYGVPEAQRILLAWCDTWREAILAEIDTKPRGFAPASLFFPSGGIHPPSGKPWYDSHSHYYGFAGLPGMIHEAMLCAYAVSGDRRYLEPVQALMDLATNAHKETRRDLPPDHPDNLRASAAHQPGWRVLSLYRWLTGDGVYDEYLARWAATPTQVYVAGGGLPDYLAKLAGMGAQIRMGWTLNTTECIQTDRADLRFATSVLGAYAGAVSDFRDAAWPTMAVTWDTPSLNFAAVVTHATRDRLRVRFYHFEDEPMNVGLRPWRLPPGEYTLTCGAVLKGDGPNHHRYAWGKPQRVRIEHRAEMVRVQVPARTEWVIDLRLDAPIEQPELLPDLAIAREDVRVSGQDVHITIHNLGGAAPGRFPVVVECRAGEAWATCGRTEVALMPALDGLRPVRQAVHVRTDRPAGHLRVTLDPEGRVPEITEENNRVEIEAQ